MGRAGLALGLLALFFIPYFLLHKLTYGTDFANGYYDSASLSGRTAMVIAPHQDDEVFLAGAMIRNLIRKGCNVVVVFTTNGDFHNLGEERIGEAVEAAEMLGVPSENVVFLGYGDKWDHGNEHIYNAAPDRPMVSAVGRTETYGTSGHKDFRTSVSGQPSLYTRRNYVQDIKDVLLAYAPDYIFATDLDNHADHRAASLLFEEALCEILKTHKGYAPIVFKGFAYNTAYRAIKDFYKLNMEATLLPEKSQLNDPDYDMNTPNYDWGDRVRFLVPPEMLSYTTRSNLLFKALSQHQIPNVGIHASRAANSDIVFWERRTDSLLYDAVVTATSGDPAGLTDFKLVDSSDISPYRVVFDKGLWMPAAGDREKRVSIRFAAPQTVGMVSLYDHFSLTDNIVSGTLGFSDGTQVRVGPLKKNGARTDVVFPAKHGITSMTFRIDEFEGVKPGLSEIEAYEEQNLRRPRFIKLMLAKAPAQTFLYRYICEAADPIPLDVYMYPNTLPPKAYTIKLIDDGGGAARLEGHVLTFKKGLAAKRIKVRVELVDDPAVYDEVVFITNNGLQNALIRGAQRFEEAFEMVSFTYYRVVNKIYRTAKGASVREANAKKAP